MTTADDLPSIPWTQYQWVYWTEMEMREHVRAYALAARAERDAEIERLKSDFEISFREHNDALKASMLDQQRLVTAEARANELEHQLEIAEHDSVSQSQLYSEYTEEWAKERDTLQKRVAELEEKLMVMCVAQINEPEVAMDAVAWMIEANDPALYEKRARWFTGAVHAPWTTDPNKGLRFPTKDIGLDILSCIIQGEHSDGKIFTLNCEFKYISVTEHVWSDEPSPDPPAPAPLAAQDVEGEPHHER